MIAFIEDHGKVYGVEPICRVLPIASSTFYAQTAIARDPDLASDRAKRDMVDSREIKRIFDASGGRYGARKIWHGLPRDTQVAALSNRNMKAICDRLNGTPRKCLGWRTPTEAFREEMMKLR